MKLKGILRDVPDPRGKQAPLTRDARNHVLVAPSAPNRACWAAECSGFRDARYDAKVPSCLHYCGTNSIAKKARIYWPFRLMMLATQSDAGVLW